MRYCDHFSIASHGASYIISIDPPCTRMRREKQKQHSPVCGVFLDVFNINEALLSMKRNIRRIVKEGFIQISACVEYQEFFSLLR